MICFFVPSICHVHWYSGGKFSLRNTCLCPHRQLVFQNMVVTISRTFNFVAVVPKFNVNVYLLFLTHKIENRKLKLMFIHYFLPISLRTESYKRELFERAWIYLLFSPEIFTKKLAKRGYMNMVPFPI